MNILMISNEHGKFPSGVSAIINELCLKWNTNDQITLLLNSEHWNFFDQLVKIKKINIDKIPEFYLKSSVSYFKYLPKILKLILIPIFIILEFFRTIILIAILIFYLKSRNINTVLSHNGGWPGGSLNRVIIYVSFLLKIKKRILIIHSMPVKQKKNILIFLQKIQEYLINYCSTDLVTVSNICKNKIENNTHFNKKISVIYNGIDSSEKKFFNTNKDFWTKKNIFTIAYVGSLERFKGIHILLRSIKRIAKPVELLVIGNGNSEYLKELKKISKSINHKIHFTGFRDDVDAILNSVDVLVLPSIDFESFGIVILEAMRKSIAVICSDFGGMKEIVVNNHTGLLYNSTDENDLYLKIQCLIDDEKLKISLGKNGKMHFLNKFTSVKMYKDYLNLVND
tara:strand:- start:8207 stop:9397 length:1191 start_codon:yes stop_codon:yes gene_type:complete